MQDVRMFSRKKIKEKTFSFIVEFLTRKKVRQDGPWGQSNARTQQESDIKWVEIRRGPNELADFRQQYRAYIVLESTVQKISALSKKQRETASLRQHLIIRLYKPPLSCYEGFQVFHRHLKLPSPHVFCLFKTLAFQFSHEFVLVLYNKILLLNNVSLLLF